MTVSPQRHAIHVVKPNTAGDTLKIRATVALNPDGTVTLEGAAHYAMEALDVLRDHMRENEFSALLYGISVSIVPPASPVEQESDDV